MLVAPNNFIYKLSDKLQKNNSLKNVIKRFILDYNMTPCIGVEIEFYLSPNINISDLESIVGIQIKKEKGNYQFEIDLPPSIDLINYVKKIDMLKYNISKGAEKLGGNVNFHPKPFQNDYGNSIHFHISFDKELDLIHQAQSICHYMLDSFLIFMPNEEDYLRIDKNYMTPTHVSFGGNNRTVAIRMPDSLPKRLEHRISSPSIDSYLAIYAILQSILMGLDNPDIINKIPKTFGNAFDTQYNLVPLPTSRKEAMRLFNFTDYIITNLIFK